jgi:hypothetical protein
LNAIVPHDPTQQPDVGNLFLWVKDDFSDLPKFDSEVPARGELLKPHFLITNLPYRKQRVWVWIFRGEPYFLVPAL